MFTSNMISYFIVIVLSVSIGYLSNPGFPLTKKILLRLYESKANETSPSSDARVALGVNVCIDLIADAVPIMEALGISPTFGESDMEDVSKVSTKDDLSNVFSYYFSSSSAVERFVSDDDLWNEIMKIVQDNYTDKHVGGNAALMGIELVKQGIPTVVVAGPAGADTYQLLKRKGVKIADEILGLDVTTLVEDQVHVILEFKEGDIWGNLTATRANRIILTRDLKNARLSGLDSLTPALSLIDPNGIVLSGLHMLELFDMQDRKERLAQLVDYVLSKEQAKTLIHLELASIGDTEFLSVVAELLFQYVDSIGLNEQELVHLYEAIGGEFKDTLEDDVEDITDSSNDDILSDEEDAIPASMSNRLFTRADITGSDPSPQAISNCLAFIFHKFPSGVTRTLSRIHYHSFHYHTIAIRDGASVAKKYENQLSSLATGSFVGALRACNAETEDLIHGNDLTLNGKLSYTVDGVDVTISTDTPIGEWSRVFGHHSSNEFIRFFNSNVLACNEPKITVGLGDAISAAALAKLL